MSTRSTIHFASPVYRRGKDGYRHPTRRPMTDAIVYKHSDGYPDSPWGNHATLRTFFEMVKQQVPDTRFYDASYLAAKFVNFLGRLNAAQSREYNVDPNKVSVNSPMDFNGVGVLMVDPGDIEYRYTVFCGPMERYRTDLTKYPVVRTEEVRRDFMSDKREFETISNGFEIVDNWEINERMMKMVAEKV